MIPTDPSFAFRYLAITLGVNRVLTFGLHAYKAFQRDKF